MCEEPKARLEQQGAAGSVLRGKLYLPTSAVQCLHLSDSQLLKKTILSSDFLKGHIF